MFDPLDFLSNDSVSHPLEMAKTRKPVPSIEDSELSAQDLNVCPPEPNDYMDVPIQPMDLPYVQYASPTVILTVLLLLQPNTQVNFNSVENSNIDQPWQKVCQEKNIDDSGLEEILAYYKAWGSKLITSYQDICTKIPSLLINKDFQQDLLSYYTSILSKYEPSPDSDLKDRLLKHTGLRISERCGRTAQPSMTRNFQLDGLQQMIQLYEPALTSDNLGLKTWGSSLVLSRKITSIPTGYRVLELGSGTGLVGIAYALSHRHEENTIFLTDLPEIVPNLRYNVELNTLKNVVADVLDWTNPASFTAKHGEQKFDTIVIADPIYSPQHPVWLVDMIVKFLSKHGTVYLQIPIRPKYEKERSLLWQLLKDNGLATVVEVIDEGRDDWGDVSYIYKEIKYE